METRSLLGLEWDDPSLVGCGGGGGPGGGGGGGGGAGPLLGSLHGTGSAGLGGLTSALELLINFPRLRELLPPKAHTDSLNL